jgi:hypothetical protein
VSRIDPKKTRAYRPVRGDCASSVGPPAAAPNSSASTETETEMAAPRLDGPQHAPSSICGLIRVRMEAWRLGSPLGPITPHRPTLADA